ncbi:putative ANTIBIOTIC-RESISTANCE PROTEIN [Enhygromyxa salina]|uniref:Putative ANTIBIOTIC-RESISTANCE PROTEIN n=1 Tax=Enhygromyxa salina TaxID=215803 RepID=A0A0C1ZYC5_9BACT|nr:amidohydrolase family protein [Enhygromyxa salina]KIG16203.1 putative ANTIBIOTIC-RESISTANCE PROTEIN [Enhygromyxa salina]
MIIDAWIQHPTPAFMRDPMFASLLRWMGVKTVPDEIPIEFTIAALDAAKVDRALVSAWYGPTGPLLSNDEVAAITRAHPERFVGVGSVDLRRPIAAVDEVRRCVEELGFKAIRLLPWLWELAPDNRLYYPIYAACVAHGVPFCTQVGHTGPMRGSEYGRPIPHIDNVALDFPELTIVGGHVGYPWTDEMIALATKYPNVFIDTSAYKPSRLPAQFVEYMRKHGRKKVLFGSNWPMIAPAQCVAQIDDLGLDDEARALYLHGNAQRVFGLS